MSAFKWFKHKLYPLATKKKKQLLQVPLTQSSTAGELYQINMQSTWTQFQMKKHAFSAVWYPDMDTVRPTADWLAMPPIADSGKNMCGQNVNM